MENQNNTGLSFYRLKTEWITETDTGALSKVKTEELVMATSYTEAEKVAYAIAEDQDRRHFGDINIEIIKTKISNILYNDILKQDENMICGMICNFFEEEETESETGLYSVKVVYIDVNEKTGKEKRTTENIYVPATSNANATSRIKKYLNDNTSDYIIRETKFDKSEAIYWPKDVHQSKVSANDFS